MKYFSIVIPTMWLSDKLYHMLERYESDDHVKEVIVINNDPLKTPDLSMYKKVSMHTRGYNIFVNPAWNWGASMAKYNLIIANDDILIENTWKVFDLISSCEFNIVGAKIAESEGEGKVQQIKNFPSNSYGCFMYVKDYKIIPDELKIWYGDRIQFMFNKPRGILINCGIYTVPSTTINSNKKLFRNTIGSNDRIIFKSCGLFN